MAAGVVSYILGVGEISTSPLGLGILYKTILAENCQNLKMAAIGRNI